MNTAVPSSDSHFHEGDLPSAFSNGSPVSSPSERSSLSTLQGPLVSHDRIAPTRLASMPLRSSNTKLLRRQPADRIDALMEVNKKWAADHVQRDPDYFNRLCSQQSPEYLWIGCADSRVPANVIVGLDPGQIFTQRNVGNQATHTDLNVMACIEYAVSVLKVKGIICCGHYGCGAVKAALTMPSKTQGLVNCWISDIRECRNQHAAELKALDPAEQADRLCELNVIRQTFNVCTSPILQNAWDQGQDVSVYGMCYSLKDGILRKLVGPLNNGNICLDQSEYENSVIGSDTVLPTALDSLLPALRAGYKQSLSKEDKAELLTRMASLAEEHDQMVNTQELASKVAEHVAWSGGGLGASPKSPSSASCPTSPPVAVGGASSAEKLPSVRASIDSGHEGGGLPPPIPQTVGGARPRVGSGRSSLDVGGQVVGGVGSSGEGGQVDARSSGGQIGISETFSAWAGLGPDPSAPGAVDRVSAEPFS